MRLLLDEMIGHRVAAALREAGLDVVAISARADLRSLPDEAVLEVAHGDGRILVTRNVSDFARLDHEWQVSGRRHAGLLMVVENSFPQNRRLVGAVVVAAVRLAAAQDELPGAGEVRYLRPVTPTG